MLTFLDFEKPVAQLQAQIAELRAANQGADGGDQIDMGDELAKLEAKSADMLKGLYASLSPWQKTQVARHPQRPHFRDYVEHAFTDFMPLGGDRYFGEDHAIIGGFATLRKHNFGMGKPEGYRKAIRLMDLAGRFGLPVVTLVDTSGAFPGIEAEERGQAEAIARSTEACLALPVPMVATIVGEGGSGGAVALASAERVLMFEHAIYSVISPEGCASILWRTAEKAADAAEAMKVTAQDLKELGVIDRIVPEPVGGAHRDPKAAIRNLADTIDDELTTLARQDVTYLQERRADRFLAIGT